MHTYTYNRELYSTESQHSESRQRGCVRLTWRMSRDPAWRSWTLRSYGVVGVSEPFREAGRGILAAQKGLGSDTVPRAPPWSEAPTVGHISSPMGMRPSAALNTSHFPRGAQVTSPKCRGAAVAPTQPPSAPGLPVSWWGGQAGSQRGKCSWPCGPRTGRSLRQCCRRASREKGRQAGPGRGLPGPRRQELATRPRVMWPRPPGSSAAYARWSHPGRRGQSRRWYW